MSRIAVLLLSFGLVTGQTSNKDECEKNVNDYFDHVKISFVIPSNISIPPSFDDVTDLLNRLKKLISNIANLGNVKINQNGIENNILDANETDQIKRGIEVLKSVHDKIEFGKSTRNRTKNECRNAKAKYDMLVNDFNAIDKLGSTVNKNLAQIFGKMKKTKKKSIQVEHEFHSINIPDFASAKYICSTRLADTIKDTILTARRIKNILIQQKEQVLSTLKDVIGKTGDVGKSGAVPKPILEGGEETTVRKLKQQVDTLRNRVEGYKQMQVPLLNWNGVILKLEQRLKEDIQKAEEMKKLLVQRDESKQSFKEIGEIVKGLCERGVCNITEPVTVEQ